VTRPHRTAPRLLAALAALAALACSSSSRRLIDLTPQQWEAEVRKRGVDPSEVPNPLLVTSAMQEDAIRLAGSGTPVHRLDQLQASLFDTRQFPFSYQLHTTLTAAEAYHRRQGNCLSFTNLFVAMGRSIGIPVSVGLVLRARSSEKEGDLIVVNNHVLAAYATEGGTKYYDFDRTRKERPALFIELDDLWVTAVYLNNRGADQLRGGHDANAEAFFLNSVRLAPKFAFAWGNLGVARRRLGDTSGALEAYGRALELEPDNPTILGNLAGLFLSLGREAEARTALEAASMANASPHQLLVRGDIEMSRGRIDGAIYLYKRARRMAPKLPDPYVAIARAELARGRPAAARKSIERALSLDPGNREAAMLASSFPKAGPGA
jgi:Flp pilus assembly protein TadD